MAAQMHADNFAVLWASPIQHPAGLLDVAVPSCRKVSIAVQKSRVTTPLKGGMQVASVQMIDNW
jgi:hypothetical protein